MSTPGLRERKKQKTRWAIQEHALRLFQEQGYDQTTVDQIAAAAEISPSTFFRYFKTKEDVVLDDDYDPLILALIADAPAEFSPIMALRHALVEGFGNLDQAERTKIYERTKLLVEVPALRMRSLDNATAQIDMIARAVATRAHRSGSEFAARTIAGAFFGATLVAILTWVEGEGKDDLVGLFDRALDHLDGGLDLPEPQSQNRPTA